MSSDVRALAREARELIASARALVAEFAEEGIDAFDPTAVAGPTEVADPKRAEADAAQPAAARSEPETPTSGPAEPARIEFPIPAKPAPREPGLRPAGRPASGSDRIIRPIEPGAVGLDAVRAELGDCQRCSLCEGRQHIVFGDGDPDANILFVGEGPGQTEDEQGLPFVGRAGELLTQMIEKGMGLARSEVYICNIVKCRPPRNRTPLPDEVAACRPFLDGQIAAVNPKVIVALGKPATGLLLGREVAITRVRGTWHDYRGIPLMPTLHPAYVLRQYTAENRRAVWEDLKAALERANAGRA